MSIRVMVSTTVLPEEEKDFREAYRVVVGRMWGTPGHVADELLHEPGTDRYHILAEWADEESFRAWVEDPRHVERTAPLVPFLERAFARRIFTVAVREEAPASAL